MGVVQVPHENNDASEQGLVAVGDQAEIEEIAGKDLGENLLAPQDHAGQADDGHAPEDRQVAEFFFQRKAGGGRLDIGQVQPVLVGRPDQLEVVKGGHHRQAENAFYEIQGRHFARAPQRHESNRRYRSRRCRRSGTGSSGP